MDGILGRRAVERFYLRSPVLLAAIAVVTLVTWEMLVRTEVLNPRHFATPTNTLRLLMHDLQHPIGVGERNVVKPLSVHVLLTGWRWLRGFLLSVIIGIAAGFVIASSRLARRVGFPIVNVLRALPSAAIWPIAAVAVGFSARSQLIVIVFGSLWPVLLNTANALAGLHQELRDSLEFMHLHRWQRLWILTQLAAAGIFTGIEIACSVAFLLSVTVEMLYPSEGGIGWYLNYFANQGDPAPLFAGVVLTAAVGWLLNTAVSIVRRLLLFWESDGDEAAVALRRLLAVCFPRRGATAASIGVRDCRLASILASATVTEAIAEEFGDCRLNVLQSAAPYFAPTELARIMSPGNTSYIRQRDVVLEAPVAGSYRPILFAQSWVNESRLTADSRAALKAGTMTLGQIVRRYETTWSNEDIAFRAIVSDDVGRLVGQPGAQRAVERRRLVSTAQGQAILIHEYYPTKLA